MPRCLRCCAAEHTAKAWAQLSLGATTASGKTFTHVLARAAEEALHQPLIAPSVSLLQHLQSRFLHSSSSHVDPLHGQGQSQEMALVSCSLNTEPVPI
jgi:hypothetical protein